MSIWRRVGLRGRLALALASVAIVSVGLATLLADAGLHSRLDEFARARLNIAVAHSARLAAALYRQQGRWTPAIVTELDHFAEGDGYRLTLSHPNGGGGSSTTAGLLPHPRATASVVVDGRVVGTITFAPVEGEVLTAAASAADRSSAIASSGPISNTQSSRATASFTSRPSRSSPTTSRD